MILVVLLTCVSLAPAATAKPRVNLVASYTHPEPNPGYSWVCVKVTGTVNTKLKVSVTGGNVLGSRTKYSKIASARGVIVKFKINAPAGYNFTVVGTNATGKTTKRAPVNVPQPGDGTPSGPFSCV